MSTPWGVFIDERVHYVGVSKLREFSISALHKLGDEIFVIQDNFEPVAVLLSYKLFQAMQETLTGSIEHPEFRGPRRVLEG